ncbi:MAG: hypothetical protein JWL82_525 [Parcubacteria group bacterium]|nr:hypothetical protein [Parcubacteria group bacterium]
MSSVFCNRISVKSGKGFTLIEMLIVVSLITAVAALGLFVSMDSFRSYHFHNERDTVVSTLQKARSQAMSNMCFGNSCTNGKPHGVYFGTKGSYVIFQGASYAARDTGVDEVIEAKDAAATITGFTSVVFARLSGDAVTLPQDTLTVTDESGKVSVITVTPQGRITWSN